MNMKPKFEGKIQQGIPFFNTADFSTYNNQECTLIIGKVKQYEIRSNQQNRYMFGVVYKLISEHTGFSVDEVHELCKGMFLKQPPHLLQLKNGKHMEINIVRPTSSLSTVELENYLSEIRMWASIELGVYIPLPNETEY